MKNVVKLISILTLGLVFIACSDTKNVLTSFEGKMVYQIFPENNSFTSFNSGDSLNFQVIYAQDSMLRIDNFTPIGKQIYIEHLVKKRAYILMSLGEQRFAIQTYPDTTSITSLYQIKEKSGYTIFGGKKAKNLSVFDKTMDTTFTMNYFEDIPTKYSTAFNIFPGLPVNYYLTIQNELVNYRLISFENKPVNRDLFGIPSNYQIISMDDFVKLMETIGN